MRVGTVVTSVKVSTTWLITPCSMYIIPILDDVSQMFRNKKDPQYAGLNLERQ